MYYATSTLSPRFCIYILIGEGITVGSPVDKGLEERSFNLNLVFVCQLKLQVLHSRNNLLLCTRTTSEMLVVV